VLGALGPGARSPPSRLGTDLDPLLTPQPHPRRARQDDGQRTRALAALLAGQSLRPVVSHLLPLSEAAQAHRILEGKHAGGKIVLTVSG
jgi:NADPH:quinone reductase-like Zn-dependent oxidoreductase